MLVVLDERGFEEEELEEPGLLFLEYTTTSTADISLSSVVGLTNPKAMKIRGDIREGEVVVMVDP